MNSSDSRTIEINGRNVQVPAGTTLLEAAQRLDIAVPTLCHHKALSNYGACRVCLVEVTQGDRTELKTSCNNVALEGMSVRTDSERVLRARRMVVELLLARSPDSPVILEIAKDLGIDKSRFPQREQKCVLCGLCVRMCRERMGKNVTSFAHRGTGRAVVAPFDAKSELCQACGACVSICPTNCIDLKDITDHTPKPILSKFDAGLCSRHPVYIPSAQAVPKLALIDAERCVHLQNGNCGVCKEFCEVGAIDYEQIEQAITLEVGSVVLTTGFDEFDASRKGEFGWGRYPNVVTSVQFERMLSAAGPFEGHVVRLSDGREAKKMAWIQCVGSRDSSCGNEYCSSICCMASTKQAMMAQDHTPGLEATIFYMDIRAHGKDFDQYYERAKNQNGVRYLKSMPSRIVQMPGTLNPRVRFVDEAGKLTEEEFDLVVLSVGLDASPSAVESARRLGIELNEYGFCETDRSAPLSTSRPGVFVAGAFQEPKDIPETVMQASGAASMAMELLASARNTRTVKKQYPDEHDITDEEPRIGVFICHCGRNIGSVVNVEGVVKAVESQPGVVLATQNMFTCSDTSLSAIRDAIRAHRLNRIVVASCTPRTHEPLFRETMREAGLNPFLFEMANIRDQCSWVHSSAPEVATQKSIELVKMSIGRARLLSPLEGGKLAVDQKGLVIGGGLSGMTAALSLANQGFKVHLVERSERLGGHLYDIHSTLEEMDVAGMTADLIRQVQNHKNIDVYLSTDITEVKGHVGEFHATLSQSGKKLEVTSGAVIVATGAERAQTGKFLSGAASNVLTQVELEEKLHENKLPAGMKNVVMIQCAGSRDDERPYCSRICCSMAIKNALAIRKKSPDTNVFVLYRDVRTYGFRELYYKQAREAGVVFLRYTRENEPVVSEAGGLKVNLTSPDFPEPLVIEADMVALSTGIEADRVNNKRVSDMLKVPLNADGFYVEAHMKLRPVDFATEGVFLCGLAHSPKFMDESIAQARAAAARAATILSKTQLDVSPQVSWVDQNKCISCMTCVHACPYGAPYCNTDGKGQIEAAKCMGCGICASECPARAIQLHHFETDQFRVMIRQLFAEEAATAPERTPTHSAR